MTLTEALIQNPEAKVSELPQKELQQWLDRLNKQIEDLGTSQDENENAVCKPKPDEVFLTSVREFALNNLTEEATYWDPYDEGYDDGPEEVIDAWRRGERISTGQYRGWVYESSSTPFDPLSAELLLSHNDSDDQSPKEIATRLAEWRGPRPASERFEARMIEITQLFKSLPKEMRKSLLERLEKL